MSNLFVHVRIPDHVSCLPFRQRANIQKARRTWPIHVHDANRQNVFGLAKAEAGMKASTIRPCHVGSQSSLRQSLFLRSMNSKMPLAEVRPKFAKRASRRGQRAVEILKSCVGRIRVHFDHESKLAMTPAAKVLPRESIRWPHPTCREI